MAGGAAGFGAGEEQDGFGAVGWVNGLMGEGALGVETGQQVTQFVVGERVFKRNFVLGERGADAVAGEHSGPFDDGGRADAVDAHAGGEADGEFADEMRERGLADVVGLAAALGHDGVGGAGEDNDGVEGLLAEGLGGFVGEKVVGGDVDVEGGEMCIRDRGLVPSKREAQRTWFTMSRG